MARRIAFVLTSLLALSYAKSLAPRAMRVHERRDSPPSGYANSGPASPNDTVHLRFALAQSNFQGLEDALYDVSTPSSAQYRRHLSKEEVEKFVAPTAETVLAVDGWLSSNGLTSTKVSPAGDWISVSMTVEQANKLLDADFSTFTHLDTGKQAIRTLSYSIPIALQDHMSFVHPTIVFPMKNIVTPVRIPTVKVNPAAFIDSTSNTVPASCETQVTPACLQAQYGIPTAPATQSSNRLGVSAFFFEYANNSDLQSFLQTYRPDLESSSNYSILSIDGGENSQDEEPGFEANLDIQYTVGVATGVPTVFITVGDQTQDDLNGFLDEINVLLNQTKPPQVLTTSYGFNENQIPIGLATKLCQAYAQLGARGVSVLFSSGDGGVSGGQPDTTCTTFVPVFPGTCPYITSVGGTQGISPEIAASLSSGGFSNYFPRPSYQDDAVSAYLKTLGSTNAGLFNATSRGFPDVAAPAENVTIIWEGQSGNVAGTSCASPIFASIVALINDQLIAAGENPLGFLNPLIYKSPDAFNDITSGNNPGCSSNGFPATTGWDPVTGFGSPDFVALRALAGL
ncbi:serine protease S53 [Heterobasidion irregulare TC 32-1]|uniref:tripeptidyl-peptidase II n=1 Tax=Heterobasidion irregulare (strain TC 32-1) TaxID=747525 RepID=W4JXE8_HETIT|nr:serine protease S53 [Heterobasidion irregulare TC 32-1]ETW78237.1 serine protease S53 [Heterobasidion irregulare TC 32-1]